MKLSQFLTIFYADVFFFNEFSFVAIFSAKIRNFLYKNFRFAIVSIFAKKILIIRQFLAKISEIDVKISYFLNLKNVKSNLKISYLRFFHVHVLPALGSIFSYF